MMSSLQKQQKENEIDPKILSILQSGRPAYGRRE
jgi:hypothetical protein